MSIDRKFMEKTARMLGVLACAGALCLGGCISPDLEPPGGGGTLPGHTAQTAPRSAAEAAGTPTATTVPSTADTGAATKPGTPTTTPVTANTAGAAAPTVPGVGAPGSTPSTAGSPATAMTAPPATTPTMGGSAAGAGAGQQPVEDGADAGVETP